MLRRRILIDDSQDEGLYVDLGLPSGILWAKGNLVKDSNGNYSIGEETDQGTYVSWGNIVGHNEGESYNFSQDYNSTAGASVTSNIAINDAEHDIAQARLGSRWHLPTLSDFSELVQNTDFIREALRDSKGLYRYGWKFSKKTDPSVYLFLPYFGFMSTSTNVNNKNNAGYYWLRDISYQNNKAQGISLNDSEPSIYSAFRYNGYTIRPVRY